MWLAKGWFLLKQAQLKHPFCLSTLRWTFSSIPRFWPPWYSAQVPRTNQEQTIPVQPISQNKYLLFFFSETSSSNEVTKWYRSLKFWSLLLEIHDYFSFKTSCTLCCLYSSSIERTGVAWLRVDISFMWKSSLAPQCGSGATSVCSHAPRFFLYHRTSGLFEQPVYLQSPLDLKILLLLTPPHCPT